MQFFPSCSCLQLHMRKRLRYAMPRVPLRKLKERQGGKLDENIEEARDAPETSAAAAKRITATRKGKRRARRQRDAVGGEDSGVNSPEEIKDDHDEAKAERNGAGDVEEVDKQDAAGIDQKNKRKQRGRTSIVTEKEDIDRPKMRKHKGRKLRVVFAESDEEDGRSGENIKKDKKWKPGKKIDKESSVLILEDEHFDDGKIEVVTHEMGIGKPGRVGPRGHLGENPETGTGSDSSEKEIPDGAKGRQLALKELPNVQQGRVRPKRVRKVRKGKKDQAEGTVVGDRDAKKNTKLGREQSLEKPVQEEIRERDLESDESSESEGGWDDGDIRLLPR